MRKSPGFHPDGWTSNESFVSVREERGSEGDTEGLVVRCNHAGCAKSIRVGRPKPQEEAEKRLIKEGWGITLAGVVLYLCPEHMSWLKAEAGGEG